MCALASCRDEPIFAMVTANCYIKVKHFQDVRRDICDIQIEAVHIFSSKIWTVECKPKIKPYSKKSFDTVTKYRDKRYS